MNRRFFTTVALLLLLILPKGGSSAGAGDDLLRIPLEERFFESPSAEDVLREELWKEFLSLPSSERPRVAVVLGGGGARGLAHVGALQVLNQKDVPVDIVCGTSVGAYVGALYASGASPKVLKTLGENIDWGQLVSFRISSQGLFNTRPLERLVNLQIFRLMHEERLLRESKEYLAESEIEGADIKDLPIPFACVAANLQTGEEVVFDSGPVAVAVRASSSIPGVFEPLLYQGSYLVDGGIINNLPVDLARRMGADFVIAVDVDTEYRGFVPTGALSIIHQVIRIQGHFITHQQRQQADVVIDPDVDDIGISDLNRGGDARQKGLIAAEKNFQKIQDLLIARSLEAILRHRGVIQ